MALSDDLIAVDAATDAIDTAVGSLISVIEAATLEVVVDGKVTVEGVSDRQEWLVAALAQVAGVVKALSREYKNKAGLRTAAEIDTSITLLREQLRGFAVPPRAQPGSRPL